MFNGGTKRVTRLQDGQNNSSRRSSLVCGFYPLAFSRRFVRKCRAIVRDSITCSQGSGDCQLSGSAHGLTAIPEEEIDSVRAVLSSGIDFNPHPFFQVGDRVRAARGVLAGIEGTFLSSGPDSKLVISIEMIQRSMATKIDGCDIEHMTPGRPLYVTAAQVALRH